MSIRAVDWALRQSPVTDTGAKLILVGLANHSTDEGTGAYPSRETLAKYASCSVRTVATKIKHLIELGVIKAGDQQMVSHIRGDRRPIVYDINFDVQISHPVRQENDDVQNLHPVETAPETSDDVQDSTPRGESYDIHGVKRSAHNTSLEPSFNPSIKNDVAGGTNTPVGDTSFNTGEWPALQDWVAPATGSSTPDITVESSMIRDDAVVEPTGLAPGVVLPSRNGWQPSAAALATAKANVKLKDIALSIARYEVVKAEKRQEPTSAEWLRWLLADEEKLQAEERANQASSRAARPWHQVAD